MNKIKLLNLISLLCYINCKILRLKECDKYDAQFSIVHRQKKLINSVSSTVNNADYTKCVIKCLKYPNCKSISFKDDASICLLHHNNSFHDNDGSQLVDAVGWTYAETPKNIRNLGPTCQSNKPCHHGRCEDTCGGKGYQCICDGKWSLQAANVCYGSKFDQFGKFYIQSDGVLTGIKLIHLSGGLTCNKEPPVPFGCATRKGKQLFGTIITMEDKNEWIMPQKKQLANSLGYFSLSGFTSGSDEIIFDDFNKTVTMDMQLLIWYGEALLNATDVGNFGFHCVEVHAMFCDE